MTKFARVALLLCVCLVAPSLVNSGELLTMRVSRFAPGAMTVWLRVEADADNRALILTAEAPAFYRSSQIQLDGARAPHTTVFELRGLPTDVYVLAGILTGKKGPRATVLQWVRVLPAPPKPLKAR